MLSIDIPADVLRIIGLLEAAGQEAYIVGGCVRDAFLGRVPNDFDITTSARPEQVKAVLAAAGIACADTGVKYGTVSALVGGRAYETTTFRHDGPYSDGRHPDEVQLLSSVDGDLARRDFTVNAMAYSPTRGLVDLFGGRADLAAGTLRCVGQPHERFAEDALRIMRALRFAATFEFAIEPATAAAIHADAALLGQVSAERIAAELSKLVCAPGAAGILLGYSDVMATIIPQVAPSIGFAQHNAHHAYTVWEHCVRACCAAPADDLPMRMAALFHDIGKPSCFFMGEDGQGHFHGHREVSADLFADIAKQLKLPRKLADEVELLVRYHDAKTPTTPAGWRRWAVKFGPDAVRRILQLQRYDISALAPGEVAGGLAAVDEASAAFEQAIAQVHVFGVGDLAIGGRDLLAAGIPQGPAIGQALRQLLAEVVEGELANERGALLARAGQLLGR